MSSEAFPFKFDLNFSFGEDSVFSNSLNDSSNITPPQPISGFFLQLDNTPLLLLDGTNFDLF